MKMSDNTGYKPQVLNAKISGERDSSQSYSKPFMKVSTMIKESFSGTSLQNHQDSVIPLMGMAIQILD